MFYGININSLILGLINTDEIKKRNDFDWTKLLQPEDVAKAIAFLLEAEFITGHVLNVDGGFVI